VDQLVIHYDACGLARTCFRVLHDERGLSVHFLLDLDGTLYQTLDLEEQAWHARQANARSIGVEVAHIGAFAPGDRARSDLWYSRDERGPRIRIPEAEGDGGLRTSGFVGRPARPEPIQGPVQGANYEQYDFTPEQYGALARLAAALGRIFPRLALEVPRDPSGAPRTDALAAEELDSHRGLLGHCHVAAEKIDPGPAFDWERLIGLARGRSSASPP
jgi:N-acetyl-anhydromuramyl-L-alanine amidase AmpD